MLYLCLICQLLYLQFICIYNIKLQDLILRFQFAAFRDETFSGIPQPSMGMRHYSITQL